MKKRKAPGKLGREQIVRMLDLLRKRMNAAAAAFHREQARHSVRHEAIQSRCRHKWDHIEGPGGGIYASICEICGATREAR